jgi:hypothetical protein
MIKRLMMAGVLAAALSGMSAYACRLTIHVACPNDETAAGIRVYIVDGGEALTDSLGMAEIDVPYRGLTYSVCVDTTTLPAGATLKKPCQSIKVLDAAPPTVQFVLGGTFCTGVPPQGACWMTGGGQANKGQRVGDFSFGGVVYPGCSPKAAGGGNFNVVDHATGLHFQGQYITVDSCSGVATSSPKVNVNVIDFHGIGIVDGIGGGNPGGTIAVTFVGRAVDNHDGGAGADLLFISVSDGSNIVMQIGASAANPATISTGNLQIHTTSCN